MASYVSDVTQFLRELKQKRPEIERQHDKGARCIGQDLDLEQLRRWQEAKCAAAGLRLSNVDSSRTKMSALLVGAMASWRDPGDASRLLDRAGQKRISARPLVDEINPGLTSSGWHCHRRQRC